MFPKAAYKVLFFKQVVFPQMPRLRWLLCVCDRIHIEYNASYYRSVSG